MRDVRCNPCTFPSSPIPSKTMSHRESRFFLVLALLAFLTAATTGAILRFGLFLGMPSWIHNYGAVRHAHSHLMYFGWGTVALMALIWARLPGLTGRPLARGVRAQMVATSAVALLSFPAFWSNGYGLTRVGSLELPLGSMVAVLNILSWIVFVVLYVRSTRRLAERPLPLQLWDWAIVLMMVASAGAVSLGVEVALDLRNPFLQQAGLHLFLDLFAVGWFTLALLGLVWDWLGQRVALPDWLPSQSLATALALTFFLGMSPSLVPPGLFWVAALANLAAGILLAWHLIQLWRRRAQLPRLAWFGMAALALHVSIAVTLLWPDLWRWSGGTQLRIFFLHNLLLGWLSSMLLALILAEQVRLARPVLQLAGGAWIFSVATMLAALLGLGVVQFLPVPGHVWLEVAAWASLGPILTGGLTLAGLLLTQEAPVSMAPFPEVTGD